MYLNAMRAHQLIEREGLDAVVATIPQNVAYVSGYRTMGFTSFEAFSVLPAPSRGLSALIVGHFGLAALALNPAWASQVFTYEETHWNNLLVPEVSASKIEWMHDTSGRGDVAVPVAHPTHTGDPIKALAFTLKALGLQDALLGFDDLNLAELLRERFLPSIRAVGCRALLQRIRLVKTVAELEEMRLAAAACQEALEDAFDIAREGEKSLCLARRFKVGLAKRNATTPLGAGGFGLAQMLYPRLTRGAVVPCAGIAIRNWYNTDVGRTVVVGSPSAAQQRAHRAITAAFNDLDASIQPGVHTDDLFPLIAESVARNGGDPEQLVLYIHAIGLDSYDYGHHTGQAGFRLEPNVVFCVYLLSFNPAVGEGFFVEDQYLVTDNGCEAMHTIPRDLFQAPLATG